LVHAGCWAHSRRKFFDAVKLNPNDAVATRIVKRIDELFGIDAVAREEKLDHAARHVLRLESAQPLVEIIREKPRQPATLPCLRARWERRLTTRSRSGASSRASWSTRSWSRVPTWRRTRCARSHWAGIMFTPGLCAVPALRGLLLRNQVTTLDEMKQALGTPVDVTVFRKLKPLDYLSSYSHRPRYYTLREIARFDDQGLWSQADVWFSRFGTLLATAEVFVNRSPRGFFADELARALHVEVQDALHQLTQQRRVTREMVSGLYLYTAADRDIQRDQILTRRTVEAVPTVPDASVLAVSEDELKASILLFYSLLDEQQRRLYAGLESLKLGRGGDHQLADFLDLDPHTVARGRQQLLAQDVKVDRVRRMGGGRKPVGKKRPK